MPSRLRRPLLALLVLTLILSSQSEGYSADEAPAQVKKYVRFQKGDTIAYGIVEGDQVRQLEGDLFQSPKETDAVYPIQQVKLLVPTTPTQVFAMAGNYKSHLSGEIPEKFRIPQPVYKSPSCLVEDGG